MWSKSGGHMRTAAQVGTTLLRELASMRRVSGWLTKCCSAANQRVLALRGCARARDEAHQAAPRTGI